jgi:predicted ATPase/class 3 adenylate cyclase
MEYRVLGPLEVLEGDELLPLGGARQRALLALLVLNANQIVPRDRLIAELWRDDPPDSAATSMQACVARLRGLLPPETLVTRPPGYLLAAEPASIDALRFEELVADARDATPAHASRLLREALGLWRGPALAELAGEPFAQTDAERLEELRLAALEERVEADLALGRHAELVDELEALVAAHPERTRLAEQLLLARADERQVEAASGPPAPPPPLERTRATVLFAALATTDEMDDDPERTAALFDRLHAEAAAEIEAAGGTVERGLVGALLATFDATSPGRQDHAARAVAAALAAYNRLTDAFGDSLSSRMGLESGEVILGRPGSFVMGAPVAAAARLVSLAQPGDIVVGENAATALGEGFKLQRRDGAHVLVRAAPPARSPEVRKMVTILFADVVSWTRLGRQLDPEGLRRLMSRYFETMQSAVERHGGIVEKFIGDAVMAIFGVPVLREDDALRAVRAAAEMRDALATLNGELERTWGFRLEGRIGVNSGEVVAGDHHRGHMVVTGEVVSGAKRLEEAAATGEILISDATYRLVRDAVGAERVTGRTVKGGDTIEALRLVDVRVRAPGRARRFDSPLVDRGRQLAALRSTYASVVENGACHLLTVLGAAGVGKSRLVTEFVSALGEDATVLHGRCLPYGEGTTYWPLAELVRELVRTEGSADAEPSRDAIAALLPDEEKSILVAELISETLGLGGTGAGIGEETSWAVRKLFEALARRRPLVVVFDDLQWAEPTFIELVDSVAELSRGAPIMLLCLARPEVLDSHPGWGGGKLNAASMLLEPLNEDDCRRLITNLLRGGSLPADVETRIAEAADGNALFAEELLAMLVDDERLAWVDGRWVVADDLAELPVPHTINSLLAARLENLPDDERDLLVRASVEGAHFHRSAVRELAPDSSTSSLDAGLVSLVRRDVIRPDRSSFAGDEGYRFRHVLIRDAAYRSLAKATRADLHERFAAWLERTSGTGVRDYEEIVGHHLEHAFGCRVDIGSPDDELSELGARASRRLESAGRRALARSDLPSAIGLLERASDLLGAGEPTRAALLAELGAALIDAGRLSDAEDVLAEARRLAAAAHDERADSHALVQQQFLQLLRVADGGTEEATRVVETVVPVFERFDDRHGLCRARRLEAWLHWNAARAAAAAEAWEQAAAHARSAGDEDERSEILNWVASSLLFGPAPVPDAIRRCEELRVEVRGNLGSEAWTLRSLAGLHAMDGRFELARELLAASSAIFEDLGQTLNSSVSHVDAIVEMLAGDAAAAERHLLAGYHALEKMGDRAFLSTTAAYLAHAIHAQGRDDEAERFTRISEELGSRDDRISQVVWRSARAKIAAGRGDVAGAEALAREAVRIGALTDFVSSRGDALIDLAQVLRASGRIPEARAAATEALSLYEQKGNAVAARKTDGDLAVLFEV